MSEPFARVTIGHLVVVCYWNSDIRQAEVYDTHAGARGKDQFEHIDTVTAAREKEIPHIFDLVESVVNYADRLDLTIDDIAI